MPGTIFFKDKIHSKELNLATNSGSRFIYTNITWRKDRIKRGFYTPKYWIEEDYLHKKTYFVIELSIPKLLFGENKKEPKTRLFLFLLQLAVGSHLHERRIKT